MQIVCTGLLKQSGSVELCSQWTASFHAALSAAYLSLKPSMHTIINQALMDCLPSSLLTATSLPRTVTADESEAVDFTLLAQSQSKSDQLVLGTSEPVRQENSTGSSTLWHPGRGIRAAWSDSLKHNSVAPLPLPDACNSKVQVSSPDADANQLHPCAKIISGETIMALSRWFPLTQLAALQKRLARLLASPVSRCTQFSQSRSPQPYQSPCRTNDTPLQTHTCQGQGQHLFPVAAAQSRQDNRSPRQLVCVICCL